MLEYVNYIAVQYFKMVLLQKRPLTYWNCNITKYYPSDSSSEYFMRAELKSKILNSDHDAILSLINKDSVNLLLIELTKELLPPLHFRSTSLVNPSRESNYHWIVKPIISHLFRGGHIVCNWLQFTCMWRNIAEELQLYTSLFLKTLLTGNQWPYTEP